MKRTASAVLALTLATFVCNAPVIALAADTPNAASAAAAPAAPQSTTTSVDLMTGEYTTVAAQGDPLSDVPVNSWAYDAVKKLLAAGIITGYPDGQFKGNRPVTRYEMAALVNRAVDGIETRIAAGNAVEKKDIDTVQKLVAAFRTELTNVETRVDNLQKTTAALQKEADASANQLRNAKIGITLFTRPGSYFQNVQANNGPLPLRVNATTVVPGGGSFPGGVGAAPNGTGIIGGVNAGTGGTGQDALVVGPYQHGTSWQDFRLQITGQLDPRFAYAARVESINRPNAPNDLGTTSPSYCTATANAFPGVGCNAQDLSGNAIPLRVNYAWVGYFAPSGFYAKLGRLVEDSGKYNAQAFDLAGAQQNGLQLGYIDQRVNAYGMLVVGNSSLTNLVNVQGVANAGCPIGFPNCANQNSTGLFGKIDYFFPSTQTDLGATYTDYTGQANTSWNPSAGLCSGGATTFRASIACPAGQTQIAIPAGLPNAGAVTGAYQTASANINTGTVFITQLFGNKSRPQLKGTFQTMHRFGNDPFTGTTWNGNTAYYGEISFASKGNLYSGPLYPGTGLRNSNVLQATYTISGLNSLGSEASPGGVLGYQSFYFPNSQGFQNFTATAQHWFTDNFRAGVVYEHFGNAPGVAIPAGSVTCPGCRISSINANAFFFDTWFIF